MTTLFRFDAYVVYSSVDRRKVHPIAVRLRADGILVWFDDWQIKGGDIIPRALSAGIEESRALVYFISEHSVKSGWANYESFNALMAATSNSERRIIPVRLDNTEMPKALNLFASVDLRENSDREYARLLLACIAPVEA